MAQDEHPIVSKEEIRDYLRTIPKYYGCIISKELHQDGKTHYHAYVRFEPKCDSTNARIFDVAGVHPNIRYDLMKSRNIVDYVTKDGDCLYDNILPDEAAAGKKKKQEVMREALELARSGDVNAALNLVRDHDPAGYMQRFPAIQAALQAEYNRHAIVHAPVQIISDRWKPEYADIDLRALREGEDYIRTHVLVGPAGIGKTQLAKYLLQRAGCLRIKVIRKAEQLREHQDADGIVFDELNANSEDNPKRWTREDQINLVCNQQDGILPARYNDALLRSNVLRIVTTNTLVRALNFADEAIERRVTIHALGNKLYE